MIILKEILVFYEKFVLIFSLTYILLFVILGITAFIAVRRYLHQRYFIQDDVLLKSNYVPGVSIIAPAFNESVTVVYNVKSMLSLNYPQFEVVLVNDGSSDDTLQKLIDEFGLVKVDFYYQKKVFTIGEVRGHYKSEHAVYSNLLVVDKVNGKSKADASNAGINSSKYPLFVCTDVDCILRRDTLIKLAKPFIESKERVVATGAAIRISNSCEIKDGLMVQTHFPEGWYPRFQELEYVRTFIFGRMAWSHMNSLLLVSGGLGMFEKEVVIAVGGFFYKSLGEDMDLITRIRMYLHEKKEKFKIIYIPESLCWTEVPSTYKVFIRQRVRWARGLFQTLVFYKKMFLNPKYGRTGLFILPHYFLFEFMVPIFELIGVIMLTTSFIFFTPNLRWFIDLSLAVYFFYLLITIMSILFDDIMYKSYVGMKEIGILVFYALLEPILYHPVNIFSSLKGYYLYLRNKEVKWGNMERKGFTTTK